MTQTSGCDELGRPSTTTTEDASGGNCSVVQAQYDLFSRPYRASNPYAYGANGNMTNDGLNSMVYDAENRLVSINSGSATYSYDGKSLRVKKVSGRTTTVYIYSGTKVIAEYENGAAPAAPTREYIYSGSQLLAKVEGGVTSYYHADQLSVRMMTDSSGNIVGQQGHYPLGEQWYAQNTTTKWQFTTYERDSESGNDYATFRYDVNRLGRFASPDLLAGSAADPQSLNRYAYVLNDPVNLVDPLGLHHCLVMGADGRCEVDLDGGGGDAEGGGGSGGGGGDGGGLIPFYNPGYCPPQFESCTSGPEGGYGGSYALYCYFITMPGVEGGTQQVPYCAQTIALAASPNGPTDPGHGGGGGAQPQAPTDKNGVRCNKKILGRFNAQFGTNVPLSNTLELGPLGLGHVTDNIDIFFPLGALPPGLVQDDAYYGGGALGLGSTLHVKRFYAGVDPFTGQPADVAQVHLDQGNPTKLPFGPLSHLDYLLAHGAGPCP